LSSFAIVVVSILLSRGDNPLDLTPTISLHGAVAADTQLCSEAGVAILQEGGNAIDAGIIFVSTSTTSTTCTFSLELSLVECLFLFMLFLQFSFKRWLRVYVRVL
jgi:hypothetical protein